jgi:hypothetical protein
MTWGWCHRAREAPLETLMRGPTTARPSADASISDSEIAATGTARSDDALMRGRVRTSRTPAGALDLHPHTGQPGKGGPFELVCAGSLKVST